MSQYSEALSLLREELCMLKKHCGETWEQVIDTDPNYARWAMKNVENLDEEIREAIAAVLP